jgi:hypothetical protein
VLPRGARMAHTHSALDTHEPASTGHTPSAPCIRSQGGAGSVRGRAGERLILGAGINYDNVYQDMKWLLVLLPRGTRMAHTHRF